MPDNRSVCVKCGSVYGEEWAKECDCPKKENNMELNEVKSSNIAAIGFSEGKQISLGRNGVNIMRIQFVNGMTYDYYDVPHSVYKGFVMAESKGKFYHANIKDKYTFEKVGK